LRRIKRTTATARITKKHNAPTPTPMNSGKSTLAGESVSTNAADDVVDDALTLTTVVDVSPVEDCGIDDESARGVEDDVDDESVVVEALLALVASTASVTTVVVVAVVAAVVVASCGEGEGAGVGGVGGAGVGFGVGAGVGAGVGLGVGAGVGLGVGAGVGLGVGLGVGAGVGAGVGTEGTNTAFGHVGIVRSTLQLVAFWRVPHVLVCRGLAANCVGQSDRSHPDCPHGSFRLW
jgi:hypothetical protein